MEDLARIADIVYKLGFPVFVAVYLLTRVDRVLNSLVTQQQEMLGLMRDVRTALVIHPPRVHLALKERTEL